MAKDYHRGRRGSAAVTERSKTKARNTKKRRYGKGADGRRGNGLAGKMAALAIPGMRVTGKLQIVR
jgi:hypothetical protein